MTKIDTIQFWRKDDQTVGPPPSGELQYGEPAVDGEGNLYVGVPSGLTTINQHIGGSQYGTLYVVADLTERDAILASQRREGMFASVVDVGGLTKLYRLEGGILNIHWVEFAGGGSGVELPEVNPIIPTDTQTIDSIDITLYRSAEWHYTIVSTDDKFASAKTIGLFKNGTIATLNTYGSTGDAISYTPVVDIDTGQLRFRITNTGAFDLSVNATRVSRVKIGTPPPPLPAAWSAPFEAAQGW